jgi:transposase InsO family protein
MGEPDAAAAELQRTGAEGPRVGAELPEEDDGVEPGANDTANRPVPGRRASEAEGLPAASLPDPVLRGRCRVAGQRGRGARDAQRTGDTEDPAAGVSRLWRPALPAAGADLSGTVVPAAYRQRRMVYQPTRPVPVAIGERRAPRPEGRPGYLRVDTVHQGDREGLKGVYHVNAVDEVTQWQVVGATAQISEAALLPVLEAVLRQFPFRIRGFHSANGSEFINHTVAALLNKLLIEQTKSRPRHSNDNGLAESKNSAVVRKHMGYGYIAAPHAAAIEAFYEQHFNAYLNFHRPCGVGESVVGPKGKVKKKYRWYATPWEILRQLPDLARHLQSGVTIEELDRQARAKTDTQAAVEMQEAKRKLFAGFYGCRSR